ncbi:hypothetical protein SADUNF_Sadunf07G0081600 [Salix dunnii]|uniref:Uncharacterized protein n=1 Tax=Salix dunnii TaxID=1413687 RepID=A0A835MVZ3_9ROSI|nr:hypothetical protein SADUNF_Sadunf07G0081600 [Salix dunnii]
MNETRGEAAETTETENHGMVVSGKGKGQNLRVLEDLNGGNLGEMAAAYTEEERIFKRQRLAPTSMFLLIGFGLVDMEKFGAWVLWKSWKVGISIVSYRSQKRTLPRCEQIRFISNFPFTSDLGGTLGIRLLRTRPTKKTFGYAFDDA